MTNPCKTSYIAPLPLRHASRVPRSLGARNRSSSRPGLVHPTTLATGTAWSHGRARKACRHQPCRGQLAAEACAAAERMKISMAAKRFSARKDAAEEVEVRSRCSRAPSPPSRAWSYRTRCSLRMGQQIQRGVSTRGGEGVRAGREAYARFHPAGKPDSAVRARGRCAPSCARGSHGAAARAPSGTNCCSSVPFRFAGVSVRTEAAFGRPSV